jgi:hypothetical protein
MESVYHIVAIRVNEISWAHVWRLYFRYLGMGYDMPPRLRFRPHLAQLQLLILLNSALDSTVK